MVVVPVLAYMPDVVVASGVDHSCANNGCARNNHRDGDVKEAALDADAIDGTKVLGNVKRLDQQFYGKQGRKRQPTAHGALQQHDESEIEPRPNQDVQQRI